MAVACRMQGYMTTGALELSGGSSCMLCIVEGLGVLGCGGCPKGTSWISFWSVWARAWQGRRHEVPDEK